MYIKKTQSLFERARNFDFCPYERVRTDKKRNEQRWLLADEDIAKGNHSTPPTPLPNDSLSRYWEKLRQSPTLCRLFLSIGWQQVGDSSEIEGTAGKSLINHWLTQRLVDYSWQKIHQHFAVGVKSRININLQKPNLTTA